MRTLLTIENAHREDPPPPFPPGGKHYIGYFANEHGEQWVFLYEYDTGQSLVCAGDTDWRWHVVEAPGHPLGVVVTESEALWLRACWEATHRFAAPASDA